MLEAMALEYLLATSSCPKRSLSHVAALLQAGCGSLAPIFSNGMFDSVAEAAAGCTSLQQCPPQSDVAVNVLGAVFAAMSLDEYNRLGGPMPAVWESYGIENSTSINVVGESCRRVAGMQQTPQHAQHTLLLSCSAVLQTKAWMGNIRPEC